MFRSAPSMYIFPIKFSLLYPGSLHKLKEHWLKTIGVVSMSCMHYPITLPRAWLDLSDTGVIPWYCPTLSRLPRIFLTSCINENPINIPFINATCLLNVVKCNENAVQRAGEHDSQNGTSHWWIHAGNMTMLVYLHFIETININTLSD